ncbi:MAG: hypothetical protein Q7I97_04395 [Thermovirgaceae bacterium]|nr:hypothetical protein [Thermovirgaceae bacterium]
MEMSVIMAFVVCAGFLAIGDVISNMTKAFVPSVFVAAVLFLFGFWTFLPENVGTIAGLAMPVALMSMYLLLVHVGTLFSIKELIAEWRTVVTALAGITGMTALLLTVGKALVGWQTVVAGTPPLTGGIVAALIMNQAATERGLTSLAVLAIVLYVMQGFVGYPLTALALKKEGLRLRAIYRENGKEMEQLAAGNPPRGENAPKSRFQFIPATPAKYQTVFVSLAKTGLVAWASVEFSKLTGGTINQFVVCLIFGVIAAEIGFLERKPLLKSQSFGYLILALMTYVMLQLAKGTPEMLKEIAGPLAIIIVVGVIGLAIASMIVGKFLGYSRAMSFALSLTALYGFPPNYILTDEASKTLTDSPEEYEFLMDQMLPKMLVGGFTSVTIVSVILAGFFEKLL